MIQGLNGSTGKCKVLYNIGSLQWLLIMLYTKDSIFDRYGLYKWIIMPIELKNMPATFIKIINNLFIDMLDKGLVVFLDDI